jgi:hypothetical protein
MRREKRDGNHRAVSEHLRKCGTEVLELLKPLDLLCKRGDTTAFVEVKLPGSAAKWTAVQLRFLAYTKFNVIVAKSGEQALRDMRDKRFVSQRSKDGIAALLAIEPRDYYTPKMVEKLFEGESVSQRLGKCL